ncbi:MAG: type I-C CRISPR-associated protein Cas8c/Csd1, partial [Firmicutes bacterium]|nr:type I-C CRISPR-associated protein Cas8c/Csd1 [Bacillota bacterium]
NASNIFSQCLVTGEIKSIARTHPEIKGVRGANPRGASLVSFNQEAFTSYGKDQSFNAPVSEEVASGYTTALNYLLDNQNRRIFLGDTTVTFWAMKPKASLEETLLAELINPTSLKEERKNGQKQTEETLTEDTATVRLIRDILKCVREGRPIREGVTEIDPEVNFCLLGLSPNNARLAVRFFHMDSFGHLVEQIARHHTDISVYRTGRTEEEIIPIARVLRETAPQGKEDKIPPLLGGALMRAILMGLPYPDNLYHAIIGRIRADQDDPEKKIYKINAVRAGLVKGYLLRKARWRKDKDLEAMLTMGLNEQSTNTAYLLGRLFALLEKAQLDAAGTELNATIKDRYFGAASATPKAVFPLLLRLAQHHLAKAESGRYRDKQIEEVLSKIDSFPAYLNLEEQGLFVLGYYHQREALYTKKQEKEG